MKKITTLFASLTLTVSAFSQIPTSGLVGYWPFNGNADDLSVSGNNGTVHNATLTTDRFGQPNSAYQFVGNDNNTVSYISADYNNLPSGNSPRTFSVWVTHDSYGVPGGSGNDGHPVLAYGSPSTNAATDITFFTSPSNVPYIRFAGFNNDLDIPFTYTLGAWYNVVTTFDGTTAKIYVNDSLIGSGNFPSWNTVLDSLFIGTQTMKSRFHNGKIDDIRIYDRVLDQIEITSLFNESICYQTITDTVYITVTDTLIINRNTTNLNPLTYENTIKLFPNPTNDVLNIDFGSNFSTMNGFTLKITNSLGQTVYTTPINSQTSNLSISAWTNGIYFVRLLDASNNTVDIRKIVLQ